MADKLRPCPFCGKHPMIDRSGPGNLVWYIECGEDDHLASMQSGGSRKEATAAWNTRPLEQELYEALRPFANFADKFDANPISNLADEMYSIHGGLDGIGASFRLSDCKKARAALAHWETRQ